MGHRCNCCVDESYPLYDSGIQQELLGLLCRLRPICDPIPGLRSRRRVAVGKHVESSCSLDADTGMGFDPLFRIGRRCELAVFLLSASHFCCTDFHLPTGWYAGILAWLESKDRSKLAAARQGEIGSNPGVPVLL